MNKLFFITFFLFLGLGVPLWAQGIVQGRVTDANNCGVELANVGVVSVAKSYGTTTDAQGMFHLEIRESDTVTLRVSCTGYMPQVFRLCLRHGETCSLTIPLATSSTQLAEVQIVEDRTRATAFTQIDIQRIENTVGPNTGVESLLKTLPDVSSNNELSSQYSVRGGSFDENLVYINDVELYRPMLIRSGQQEGMSIINADLVDHLLFSPGGFDASYGDKISSALAIAYARPKSFGARLSASFLGATASVQGLIGKRLAYAVGFRHHNNSYLFRSLDTEGNYRSSYTDMQGLLHYRVSEDLDLSLLAIATRNVYGLVPSSQTTSFGSFMESLELRIYFDGAEEDRYRTLLGALTFDYHPSDDFQLKWITSAQSNAEQELYDIQSQYWLYEVGVGQAVGDTNHFDRGVGTFLEHARNYLSLNIFSSQAKARVEAPLGQWQLGIGGQMEQISDRVREWKWVDSAGYAMPFPHFTPGLDTVPQNPLLQQFCRANNHLVTLRAFAYAQRELKWVTRQESDLSFMAGLRGQFYTNRFDLGNQNSQYLLSPRLSLNYRPSGSRDILYRIAAGVYQQPALYREMRHADGSLNMRLRAQTSYQAMGTFDWNLSLWDHPVRLTADVYYKYITHLVPYTIDNMRVQYDAENSAVAYAAGLSLRINGDLVEGLESWMSLSLMQTQEDIEGDGIGWIARPTDQRLSFKVFLQDYVPTIPWWRMSLNFIYGTRMPVTFPGQQDRSKMSHLPPYFRVDWGNSVQLSRFDNLKRSALFRVVDDVMVGLEVFNLFNYRNVISFIWVSDYDNIYYPVPNYLTARQINLKLTVTF